MARGVCVGVLCADWFGVAVLVLAGAEVALGAVPVEVEARQAAPHFSRLESGRLGGAGRQCWVAHPQ